LAGRRRAEELPHLGAAQRHPGDHAVALGDEVLDLELAVGEGGAEEADGLLEPGQPGRLAGQRVVIDEVGGDQLVEQVDAPGREGVVDTANERLVIVGGHRAAFLTWASAAHWVRPMPIAALGVLPGCH
jgi:hypothetical protein